MSTNHFTVGFWKKPSVFLAVGFGTGLAPIAPGTVASLATVIVWWVLFMYELFFLQTVLLVLLVPIAFFSIHYVIAHYGVDDAKEITIDECVGQALVLVCITDGIWWYLIGFLWFRIFDIWKFGPVRYINDKVKGVLGILGDDLMAALFAVIATSLCYVLWIEMLQDWFLSS